MTDTTETVAFGSVPSPVGDVLVAVTEAGLAATAFRDTAAVRGRIGARLGFEVADDRPRTAPALAQLRGYFAGELREFDLDLDWRLTTSAARQVLATLHATVPYGEVVTYGELAARSGTGIPPRGIGAIMGSNPIPIVVPCHRVVAGNGLGGFSGGTGVESKRRLLTLERYLPPTLF